MNIANIHPGEFLTYFYEGIKYTIFVLGVDKYNNKVRYKKAYNHKNGYLYNSTEYLVLSSQEILAARIATYNEIKLLLNKCKELNIEL